MKFRKTNSANRVTYTYEFTDTDKYGNEFIRRQTLQPGENGLSEMDIKLLHALDDHEVYNNIKNSRPPVTEAQKAEQTEWIRAFTADFLAKYGYTPTKDVIADAVENRFPKNRNISFSAYTSDDDGSDTTDRHIEFADPTAVVDEGDKLSVEVQRMREIVSACTPKQQEAYRLVYIEGYTEEEAAGIVGCSHQGIHDRLKRVVEKIRKEF